MKKIMSILLGLSIILSFDSVAFAETEIGMEEGSLYITELSDETFTMTDDEGTAVMKIRESTKETIVSVEKLQGNVEEGFFIYDRDKKTIYSSYTGKTFSVFDIAANDNISPQAVGDVVARRTHYISHEKLADAVTPTSSDISIASALITIVAATQGVTIATGAAVIIALMSTSAWDAVRDGIADRSPNHGIKVVVATVEVQKHQGGKFVTGYRYKVESISRY